MEENKKTSKEILPESEILEKVKKEAYKFLVQYNEQLGVKFDIDGNYLDRSMLIDEISKRYHEECSVADKLRVEAAEREVEEKEEIIEQMQLDDVYQQDDIRTKRADIEFLENKLKEKADEFDRVATKLAYQLRAKDKIVESYAASARVIHLHLKDYCNEDLSYDEMIADASRLAARQINELKREIEELKSRINID